jgi:integrase/recombinase XerC
MTQFLNIPHIMEGENYSEGTINQRLTAISSFFAAAIARGLRVDNPANGVKRKAVNPYGKASFLEAEQDLQLLQAVDRNTAKGKRDYAILLIFLTTAVRIDAVANLRMKDFRQQGDTAFMQYKNKGGEIVEKKLQPLVIAAIVEYLDTRSDLLPDSPVFVASAAGKRGIEHLHGQQEREKLLSSRSLQRMVQDYGIWLLVRGMGLHRTVCGTPLR